MIGQPDNDSHASFSRIVVCSQGEGASYVGYRTIGNVGVGTDSQPENRPEYDGFATCGYQGTRHAPELSTGCRVGTCENTTSGVWQ
jgi:hypothetical protein